MSGGDDFQPLSSEALKSFSIPKHLISEIREGHCVAFVGAGFSAAAGLPSWSSLLRYVINAAAERDLFVKSGSPADISEFLNGLVDQAANNPEYYDMCAQMLQDILGLEPVSTFMGECLKLQHPLPEKMQKRIEMLKGIPFKAVLTTNFDLLLMGDTPGNEPQYEKILRHRQPGYEKLFSQSTSRDISSEEDSRMPWPVMKIHGCIANPKSMVWTRTGYRQLINEIPGYMHFLRTLIATSTVLYIGFSFSDGYLNEVRGEVLSMLYGSSPESMISNSTININNINLATTDNSGGSSSSSKGAIATSNFLKSGRCMTNPLGYAIVNDKSNHEQDFFLTHEGVQILSWNTYVGEGKNRDYSGLDKYLHNVYTLTSPFYYLGKLAWGHRILMLMKKYAPGTATAAPLAISMTYKEEDKEEAKKKSPGSPMVRSVKTVKEVKRKRMSDLPDLLDESICNYREMRSILKEGDNASVHSGCSDENLSDTATASDAAAAAVLPLCELSHDYEDGGRLHVVYNSVDSAIECMKHVNYDFVVTVYGWRSETECQLDEFVSKMRQLPFSNQAPFIVTTTSEGLREKRKMCTKMGAADVVVTFNELVNAVTRLLRHMKNSSSRAH